MHIIFVTITKILFFHSDHEAQPWGGPKADKNGGAGAEPPLTLGLWASSPAPWVIGSKLQKRFNRSRIVLKEESWNICRKCITHILAF